MRLDKNNFKNFKVTLSCEFSLADILKDMGMTLEAFAMEPDTDARELRLHTHLKAMLKKEFNRRIDNADANDIEEVRS